MHITLRETAAPMLALFASGSTLLCCALPAALVTIGAGAVMVGLTTHVPGLIFISEHKEWAFVIAGVLLAVAIAAKWMSRNAPCPADPELGRACMRARRVGTIILAVASSLYVIGGFFAFFAARLLL